VETSIGSADRDRANRLATQLPESGFPSGVGVPSVCVLVLLLALAGLTAFLLSARTENAVPQAFVDAQRQLATSSARSIGASANQGLADLRIASAGSRDESVEPLLDGLVSGGKWRGAAVLNGSSRVLVAARGEPVPIQVVPADTSRPSVLSLIADNGEPRLLTLLPLGGERLLVATSAVRLPDVSAGPLRQSLQLTTLTGTVVRTSRATPEPDAPEVLALVGNAGKSAVAEPAGLQLGPVAGGTQATVAYARIAPGGQDTPIDLAVVAVAYGPVLDGSAAARSGLLRSREVIAGALAILALLGFLALQLFLARPIRRLRASMLGLAGGDLRTPVRGGRVTEVASIAAAAEHCRRTVAGARGGARTRRRGLPALVVVTVVSLALASWSAGVLVLLANREPPVPEAIVTSIRDQTGRATEALRRSMNDGLADLNTVSVLVGPQGEGALRPALDELISTQRRYRSVYLVDSRGVAGAHVGRPPLRVTERPPERAGIRQQNSSGRVPVIFAHVPFGDTGKTLVGEFDLDHLASLLGQAPGKVRLVDAEFRTISATDGYVAFERVTDSGVQRGVAQAQRGDPIAEISATSEGSAIVAATAVYGGEIGKAGWTVVGLSPVADLALPANALRRAGILTALIGFLLALLLFGWHFFTVIRPLRRVAAAGRALRTGDHTSVIYPQRHDEIGTIASCLEICRQALTQGPTRLGPARRPQGNATEETQLLPPVRHPPARRSATPPRRAAPAARDESRRGRIRQGSA
jgi:methyl-accepting chemotaxis protein